MRHATPAHAKRMASLNPPVGCRLIDQEVDEVAGIYTFYWMHPDGKVTVQRVQDADPYFDRNKEEFNSHGSKSRRNYGEGLGTKVATIPNGLIEEVRMKTGVDLMTCDAATLKRFINSSEYDKVRTAPGRV